MVVLAKLLWMVLTALYRNLVLKVLRENGSHTSLKGLELDTK
jgi:hypothetical protein